MPPGTETAGSGPPEPVTDETPPDPPVPSPAEELGGAGKGPLSVLARVARWGVFAVVVLVIGLGALAMYAERTLNMPGPLDAARNVVVPRGGLGPIADRLLVEDVIAGRRNFQIAALLTRKEGPVRAGEFGFPAHASLRDVLTVLRTARPVQHSLTIPEGLTGKQILAIVALDDALSGTAGAVDEGSVLPQTYQFELGTPRAAVLARAHGAMARTLEQEWAKRSPDVTLASPRDALILASIVERETAVAEERPHVAAVFLNRLKAGMKLQSDPTVVFAASAGAGTLDHPLTRAELERDDPYNTYRHRGLPPGPICAPGLASLHAVLHPAVSEDLYFVADGTGRHVFSRTLEEHNRNVAHWRAQAAPAAAPTSGPGAPPVGAPAGPSAPR